MGLIQALPLIWCVDIDEQLLSACSTLIVKSYISRGEVVVITDSERDNLYNSLSWYLVHTIHSVKSNDKINRDLSGYNYDFMKI